MRAFCPAICSGGGDTEEQPDAKTDETTSPNLLSPSIRVQTLHRNLERSRIPLRVHQRGEIPHLAAVFHLIAKTQEQRERCAPYERQSEFARNCEAPHGIGYELTTQATRRTRCEQDGDAIAAFAGAWC